MAPSPPASPPDVVAAIPRKSSFVSSRPNRAERRRDASRERTQHKRDRRAESTGEPPPPDEATSASTSRRPVLPPAPKLKPASQLRVRKEHPVGVVERARPPPIRRGFRISEFCQRNSVGRSFVYGEIAGGRLKAVKAGRVTIITAEAEQAWLDALPVLELGSQQAAT